MPRFHATSKGNIPFTPEEELESDAEEAEYAAGADGREMAAVRVKRTLLLAETDWAANSGVTMTAEMTAYRQGLRDVPAQAGFPRTIQWPTKPKA